MPMRVTSLSLSRGVLDDVARASNRLAKTQQKLASGKELNRPSDDPTAVARALQLRGEMESAQQLQRNVAEGIGWTSVTESALSTIVDALHRARELTVQAASDSAGPEARLSIQKEMEGLIDTMKTAANATYGGRYVFSGTETNERPYQLGAIDNYEGDGLGVDRQIGPGVSVRVNLTGPQVIGDETGGLLLEMRDIIDHLDDPGATAALSNDLDDLDDRLDEINAVRATIGATANRLEIAGNRLAEYEGTTLSLLSDTEDADMAQAMIDFSVQQNALQAGLKAGASIVQLSLLDFLR
jgi:flagellar hook-associated protein 3 FlgL